MIRRLVVAVVLIGLAMLGLHFAIGIENFATVSKKPEKPGSDKRMEGLGPGIIVGATDSEGGGSTGGSDVSVATRGAFEIVKRTEVELPSGERRFLKTYELEAADDEAVRDDELKLSEVTLRLFRAQGTGADRVARHVATIRAAEAYVQVGRDEEGQPSILEDRDMDLFGVNLETTSDARTQRLSMSVERLRARQDDSGLTFRTPLANEPFHIEFGEGVDQANLDGRGITGTIPSEDATDGEIQFDVNSWPVLTRGNAVLRAKGAFSYREQLGSGVGRFSMKDTVTATGLVAMADLQGGRRTDRAARLSGDELTGEIVRPTSGAEGGWGTIRFVGSPANARAGTSRLSATSLTAWPSLSGLPANLIAEGTPKLVSEDLKLEVDAADRIVIVDVAESFKVIEAPLRRGHYQPIASRFIAFEGQTTVVDKERGSTVVCEKGARAYGSELPGTPLLIVGDGETRFDTEQGHIVGNRGFALRTLGERQVVRLGPSDETDDHRYGVTLLTEDGNVHATGSGSCLVELQADKSMVARLQSARRDITVTHADGRVEQIESLVATRPEVGDLGVVALGSPVAFDLTVPVGDEQRTVRGASRRVTLTGRSDVQIGSLDDAPTTITFGSSELRGHEIHLSVVGADQLFARVIGNEDQPARVVVQDQSLAEQPAAIEALTIRFVPGLAAPIAYLLPHATPLTSPHDQQWIVADGAVRLYQPATADSATATGDRFRLRIADGAGWLQGAPAMFSRVEDSRTLLARSPIVRFRATSESDFELWLDAHEETLPSVDLFGYGPEPFNSVRLTSQTTITANAREVVCPANVELRGIDTDGNLVPDGPSLDAGRLTASWTGSSRAIHRIVANERVAFTNGSIEARGDTIEINPSRGSCTVFARRGEKAEFRRGGIPIRYEQLRLNYLTGDFEIWRPAVGDREVAR